jgi:Uma2 family endonuclease
MQADKAKRPGRTVRLSEAEYRRIALAQPDEKWELHRGVLVKKPAMTWDHANTVRNLGHLLQNQLEPNDYLVPMNMGRVQRSAEGYYTPDVYVVPREMFRRLYRPGPGEMEAYPEPLPLVAEVWSPSTGRYDVRVKLREYQARGDVEIWLIQPYERTLTAWRRQPDGGYSETVFTGGVVEPVALPGVAIELAALFERR